MILFLHTTFYWSAAGVWKSSLQADVFDLLTLRDFLSILALRGVLGGIGVDSRYLVHSARVWRATRARNTDLHRRHAQNLVLFSPRCSSNRKN